MNDKTASSDKKKIQVKIQTVRAPHGCVGSFLRKRDNVRIFVFPRRGEGRQDAIARVLRHNGSEGTTLDNVTT